MVNPRTRFRCFFEQSGTFKDEFMKLGYLAYDYDILNDFGKTDFVCDLFQQINDAYDGKESIFSDFHKDFDFIIAFFPCVRFSVQAEFLIKANGFQYVNASLDRRLVDSMKYERERSDLYSLFCKLCIVCLRLGLRLIVENPYHDRHYLVRYLPFAPGFIDTNRRDRGDAFEKPTMFYFVNCKPSENFIFEAIAYHPHKHVDELSTVERSMITSDYANRFIREFIL